MAQKHLEPLSATGVASLDREDGATHMHVGVVAHFDGPPPALDDVLERMRARLARVPRHRRRLAYPPGRLGRPRWVDDPTFTLDYHVRHVALPAPGDAAALERFAARMVSRRLDRGKPLWELWLVEGLPGERFALMSKSHRAVVEGVAGADLLAALLDEAAVVRGPGANGSAPAAEPWEPRPLPSAAQLAADALGDAARTAAALPLRAASAAARPGDALRSARGAAAAVGGAAAAQLGRVAPPSPLSMPTGPHRRLSFVDLPLDELEAVAEALGATVDEVVLTLAAGALRHWMQHRGLRTEGVALRAAVPVVTGGATGAGSPAMRLEQRLVPLPVGVRDPVGRLRRIGASSGGLLTSPPRGGASADGFSPPRALEPVPDPGPPGRAPDVPVTTVHGPRVGLRLLGRRLRAVHPIPDLAPGRPLALAAIIYDGTVGLGVLGDFDALGDLDLVAEGARQALRELLEAA